MLYRHFWARFLFIALGCVLITGCEAPKTEAPAPAVPKVDGNSVTLVPGSQQIDAISVEPAKPNEDAVTPITGRLAWDDDLTARVYTPISGRVLNISAS